MPTGILTKSSEKAKKAQQPQPQKSSPNIPKIQPTHPLKSQLTHPKTTIVHFSKMNKKEPSPFIHFWHRFSTIFFDK